MLCYYYPTTTAIIDDDTNFLNAVAQQLAPENCITYCSANNAVQSLNNNKPNNLKSRLYQTYYNHKYLDEDPTFHFNAKELYKEVYNKNRFNDISVIIVDYYMDEQNGLEVCEQFSDHPAKKILLTGGIDKEKVAIEAFNRGVIQKFINKMDPQFPILLSQAVNYLKESYFKDLGSSLLSAPITNNSVLLNPAYINFTRTLSKELNAIEYYLLDTSGSSLYLDSDGKPFWLIIKQNLELENFEILAIDQGAQNKIINQLKSRQIIPFFFKNSDYEITPRKWKSYFYPSKRLPGIPDCYYALVEGNVRNILNQNKIYVYRDYFKSNREGKVA